MSFGNNDPRPGGLGRRVPTDFEHVEKYPLKAVGPEAAFGPAVWGINWYSDFDRPTQKSSGSEVGDEYEYWIGEDVNNLGYNQGGHAIAEPYYGAGDLVKWYEWYDQGYAPHCVGYSLSRAMSWLNRRFYDADWLYYEAQKVDEWDGEDYDGTSVRGGCRILNTVGHRRIFDGETLNANVQHGIAAYRWITDVNEVLDVVGGIQKERGAITWRNSWGRSYPQKVWLPAETAQRLLDEDGELAVFTDR
jgi:hypothetical protein